MATAVMMALLGERHGLRNRALPDLRKLKGPFAVLDPVLSRRLGRGFAPRVRGEKRFQFGAVPHQVPFGGGTPSATSTRRASQQTNRPRQ